MRIVVICHRRFLPKRVYLDLVMRIVMNVTL
jgi:hypothetical protein